MAVIVSVEAAQAAETCDCAIRLLRDVEGNVKNVEGWSMAQPNRFARFTYSIV